jgi:hypothetical protein
LRVRLRASPTPVICLASCSLELGQSDPSWSTICGVAKALDVRLREIVTAVESQHQANTKER